MAYNSKEVLKDVDGNPISQYYDPITDSYKPVEGSSGGNKVSVENNQGLSLIPILDKLSQLTGTVIDEETRKSNEITREQSEDTRQSQESTRQSQESTRQNNEDDRELVESQRVTSEGDRISAESIRITNEDTRQNQESTRQNQESARVSNEDVRESQESVRESNEDLRIALYDDLLSKVATGFFKGEKGDTGNGLEYTWNGTQLGIRVEGTTEYVYVDLKGEKGDTGDIANLTSNHITTALGYTPLSEDSLPNNLETTTGSQAKADIAEQNAKNYTDSELASFEGMSIHGNDYHTENYATELDLETHLAESVSQGEVHDLRVVDEKLEYFTGTEWKIASGGIPVGNVSGLSVEENDAEITLTWADPDDRYLDDVKIAEWQGTKLIRKEGSYPVSDDDGVLVVDNTTKNQYSTNGYKDTGLTNEVTYYYMAFPYTEDAITVDGANRVAGTPIDVDDKTGSPGSAKLIAGDMNDGFFGVVPASELFTGAEISSECGITQGTLQFSDVGWLKFAIDGEIIFKSQKTYRHSISWDYINGVGAVKGTKQVSKGGINYKVTLLKGGNGDAANAVNGPKGSEWNRLMLPIHIKAKDQSWAHPANVDVPTAYWGIDFTDADLRTHYDHGYGVHQWCQETFHSNASGRVYRGGGGVSFSNNFNSLNTTVDPGWSPVLRVIK